MKLEPCSKCGGSGKQVNQTALGADLRLLRKKARIGLREMARGLGISAPYLCDLERGRRPWSEELESNFRRLCKNYDP